MPGLVGIIPSGQELESTVFDRMVQSMCYEPTYTVQRACLEGASMASVCIDEEPTLAQSGDVTLLVDGDFAELDDLRDRLATAGETQARSWTTPEVLLHAFRRFGAEALCSLNGLHAICIWEASPRRLTIVTDRYGFRKLLYWQGTAGFVYASEMKALLAHPAIPRKVDTAGLTCFLNLTHLVGDLTLIDGIRQVPAACVMTYCEGNVERTDYGGLAFGEPGQTLDPDTVLAETAQLLRQSVQRRLKDNTYLLLTGGLDSRSIAGCIGSIHPRGAVGSATIGHRHCHDVRFGRRIAEAVGLPHRFLPVDASYFQRYWPAAMARTEGRVSSHGYWHLAADALVREHGVRSFMVGSITMGLRSRAEALLAIPDAYRGWARDEGVMRYDFEQHMEGGFKEDELADIVPPHLHSIDKDLAYRQILRTFHNAPTDHVPSKVDFVTVREHERGFIVGNFEMLGGLTRVSTPFLDRDLFDYTFATRPSWPMGKREHLMMIARHFPEVAGVSRTSTIIPPNASWFEEKLRRGVMRLHYSILPKLTGGRLGGHSYGRYVHYDEWLRIGARAFVAETLGEPAALEGLVNVDTAKRVVADHMSGRTNDYSRVCLLLTLALWRRAYAIS